MPGRYAVGGEARRDGRDGVMAGHGVLRTGGKRHAMQ